MSNYPEVKAPEKAGSYPATAHAGGGYVWEAVLEYRVWCHPEKGCFWCEGLIVFEKR